MNSNNAENYGILLVDKPAGISSFQIVRNLRRKLNIKKIGHAGTLDPFATGLMVMLIGRDFTKLSDTFLTCDKEYTTTLKLGESTTSYDSEGEILTRSEYCPSISEVESVVSSFQGTINQIPPMFSAKKIHGKKLYELARQGQEVERQPVEITVTTEIIEYSYPHLKLRINCSKGTYIRSIGHEIGAKLQCGAYLAELRRIRSGSFLIENAISMDFINNPETDITSYLIKTI